MDRPIEPCWYRYSHYNSWAERLGVADKILNDVFVGGSGTFVQKVTVA